jgi:ubiquinol-cytochrome c reductase cytochrome c1 subunit
MMKRAFCAIVLGLGLAAASGTSHAAGAAMGYLDAKVDLNDKGALQKGAALFVNYCLSCHSMAYMRYNRMGRDLGLSDEQVAENLLLAGEKVVERMTVAMDAGDAERWFGIVPPDLSVIARARGADWLYSYLVTFYRDDNPSRPFGVNNVVLSGAAMPHVLWPLQGHQRYVEDEVDGKIASEHVSRLETSGDEILVHRDVTLDDGTVVKATDRLQVDMAGEMLPGEFRAAVRDLVSFLVYAAEPAQLERYGIGLWVLLFLAVLFVLARLLYKEYWKDVH